jgi:hypothetical protein
LSSKYFAIVSLLGAGVTHFGHAHHRGRSQSRVLDIAVRISALADEPGVSQLAVSESTTWREGDTQTRLSKIRSDQAARHDHPQGRRN